MSLIEQTNSLIRAVREEAMLAEAKARQSYLELLARNNDPLPGDAKKLQAVMQALGKPYGDLQGDLAAVEQSHRLEKAAEVPPELAAEIATASDASSLYSAETESIVAARKIEQADLDGHLQLLRGKLETCRDSKSKQIRLRRQHHLLFGCEGPPDLAAVGNPAILQPVRPGEAPPAAAVPSKAAAVPVVIPKMLQSSGRLLPPADPGVVEAFKNRVGVE
jgi:hypothetical protein